MPDTADDTISRTEHEAALRAAREDARGHGERIGRTAATERIRAILMCGEAKGREAQALVLALDTDVTPDVAAKALAAAALPAWKPAPAVRLIAPV